MPFPTRKSRDGNGVKPFASVNPCVVLATVKCASLTLPILVAPHGRVANAKSAQSLQDLVRIDPMTHMVPQDSGSQRLQRSPDQGGSAGSLNLRCPKGLLKELGPTFAVQP